MSYALLSRRFGVQWPCNDKHPDGKERLYDDFHFPTGFDECGEFGHDWETGGHLRPTEYKANVLQGKAWLQPAEHRPPHETPNDEYPFFLSTGRVVYQFHTRTKTGRSVELQQAAPDVFVQVHVADVERHGIAAEDLVEVSSRRGMIRAKARLGDVRLGHLFVPFHYWYWDQPNSNGYEHDGRPRAANELNLTAWDVVSMQPIFKYAAVKLAKIGAESLLSKVVGAASGLTDRASEVVDSLTGGTRPRERSHVSDYLGHLIGANEEMIAACEYLSCQHARNAEIRGVKNMSALSRQTVEALGPFAERYGRRKVTESRKLRRVLFPRPRAGGFGLLRDLHSLHLMVADALVAAKVLEDAARELRDDAMHDTLLLAPGQNQRQQAWVDTMLKETGAQSVLVPS